MTQDDIQNFYICKWFWIIWIISNFKIKFWVFTTSEDLEEELKIDNTVSLDLQNEFLEQNNETDITNRKHQDQAMPTNRAAANQKSRKK